MMAIAQVIPASLVAQRGLWGMRLMAVATAMMVMACPEGME